MKNPKILILGATGKVGGEVARLLSQSNHVDIVTTVRPGKKKPQRINDQHEIRELDLDVAETIPVALEGVDRILMVTGYSVEMLRQSKRLLDEAKKQNVQHIVHIGASGSPTTEVPHWGWHQMVEAYIEQKGFSWTHLRPEAYMQNVTGPGFCWLDQNELINFIVDSKWSWVDANDVAAVAAKALIDTQKLSGKVIPLGYDAKTLYEVAEILSHNFGRTIRVKKTDPQVFHDSAISGGMEPAYINSVFTQFKLNAQNKIPESDRTFENFESIVGRAPTTWNDFAKKLS